MEKFEKKDNFAALLPIGIFIVFYLGLGFLYEYGLKMELGFYKIPVVVAFLIALTFACLQNSSVSFDEKLTLMGKEIGHKDIVTMILIFLAAGAFVGVVGRSSAESVAYFVLSLIPTRFAVVILFVVACFISLSMGTSVGTISLITPIAVAIGKASGFDLPICIGAVVGGAMFGDNLSFISDTTIAACNGQGCEMKDKFRENFAIALPAALATLVCLYFVSLKYDVSGYIQHDYNLIQIIPYLLVLLGGIIGFNVFVILLAGIVTGSVIVFFTGATQAVDLLSNMGAGCAGMFETAMVAVLVSAIGGLVKANGGFDAALHLIKSIFKGRKGGQLGIGILVSAMDVATANNTVAIVMSNQIAKEMAGDYGISPRKTASILDTFSCIVQGALPYGAQILVAVSAAASLGCSISAFDIIPNLYYPFFLLLSSLVFIFFIPEKTK